MKNRCPHNKTELLGQQKGEKGINRYFRCLKCATVLILSEDGNLYEISGKDVKSKEERE